MCNKQWCATLEPKGLRLSLSKTEYLWANFSKDNNEDDVVVCIFDERVLQTNSFEYLGSIIQNNGDIAEGVTHRIEAG